MNRKAIITVLSGILLCISCNNNEDSPSEEENVFLGCCSVDPVFGDNVNNLDESEGEIKVYNILTANNDGFNDKFSIENIQLYANHTVSIFYEDNLVYSSSNYGESNNFFPVIIDNNFDDLAEGTYKYKIVVENEDTYLKSGTFCLVKGLQPEGVSFADCENSNGFDPALNGL